MATGKNSNSPADVLVMFDSHPSAVLPFLATVEEGATVAIAHSVESASAAHVMVDYLATSERFGGINFALWEIGEGYDFADTLHLLDHIPLANPYRLNYTAGTRVTSASSVWKHLVDHNGENHQLRTYLDNWTGKILHDAEVLGENGEFLDWAEVPSDYSVVDMIGATGHEVTVDFGPVKLNKTVDSNQAVSALENLRKAVVGWHNGNPKTQQDLRTAVQKAAAFFTGFDPQFLDSDDVGRAGEVLAGGIVAVAAAEALDNAVEYEVLGGVTVNEVQENVGRTKVSAVAEFDVVLRLKQRIIHFEAKRADYNARGLFVERDALGRFVFGSESHMWTVTFRETDQKLTEEMEALEELGRVEGTQQDRYRFNSVTQHSELVALIEEIASVISTIDPHRENLLPVDTVDLPDFAGIEADAMVCSLGVPSAVQALAGELGAVRLGCFSSVPFATPLPAGATAVDILTPKMHALTGYEAATAVGSPVVAVTTGPKSVSSGFVRYVFEQVRAGRTEVEMLHIDREAVKTDDGMFARCVRRGNPVAGWSTEPRTYEEQFTALAQSDEFVMIDDDSLKAMPRVVGYIAREARKRGIEVWIPRESDSGRLDGFGGRFEPDMTVDVVVLTGHHVTGTVAVVDQDFNVSRGKRPSTSEVTWARKRIVEEEGKVEQLFNGLNRVLVCIPPHFDNVPVGEENFQERRSSWDAVAAGNDWQELVHFHYPYNNNVAYVEVPESFWRELE